MVKNWPVLNQVSSSGSSQIRHTIDLILQTKLVSWSLTSLFSTNMAISEMKGQGWKVIRTQ